ncbi:DUF6151 family protein [Sagittula sp. S175]|uniref:DUF6151 family protein n=1 Tax=Sagittula sp. S175 TaxID=3415129 RepID=UPI003C7A1FBC
MRTTQHLSCSCGKTNWSLSAQAPGRHIVCYCKDCQAFARHTGHPEILAPHGGTHIWQTTPDGLHFTSGADLNCLRLSPRGLLRWYAACCGSPIANTLPKPTIPFIGAIVPAPAECLGPPKGRVNTDSTRGAVKEKGFEAAGATLIGRAIGAFFRQKTQSPFFTEEGTPMRDPKVLTLAERNAASTGPA